MIRSFLKDAGIVILATSIANVCNLLYQLYMVRNLDVQDFGVLTALLTGLFILAVPCFALQAVMAKWTAQFQAKGEQDKIRIFFWDLGKWVVLFAFALIALGIAGADALAAFLKIERPLLVMLTVFSVAFATIFPLWLGLLQGIQRFWVMGSLWIATSVIKLVLAIVFVTLGMAVDGALWAVLLSFVVVLPVAFCFCRTWTHPVIWSRVRWSLTETREAVLYMLPTALMFFCFTLLTQLDILLVKHFFDPFSAGLYATGAMVGKITLFLPLAVGWVLLPKVAGAHAKNKNSTQYLRLSLGVVTILCGGAVLVAFAFPSVYVWLFRVSHPQAFIPLARLSAVAMSFYALTNVVMTYHISVRNLSFLLPTVLLTVLEIGLIWKFHGSLTQVLWILCAVGVTAFLVNLSRVRWVRAAGVSA